MNHSESVRNLDGIAIIGIAVRMPGAADVREFWQNLKSGTESISVFTQEELLEAGVSPDLLEDPNLVPAKGVLDNAEMFDANFFGISPHEAELMDPQHRVLMECAWAAMEDAGYVAEQYPGRISIFTSAGMNSYLPLNLMSNPGLTDKVGGFALSIYNDKDFVPTRIAYSMNIKGPAIDIGTACSSSLVSTHLACQHILTYQSDMALVGGITIHLPQKMGHFYEPGSAYSPDVHCRPFDATPSGLIDGNGAAVIILKRLEDAINDGDKVHAVIKGSAINNDGSDKVGYAAPSINGQASVILEAQAMADIEPETISYVETHGTSTPLGDPIELAGLTQAFRTGTDKSEFCGIGSVKSNIGHVDKAAGLAGLIKVTLGLEHELIPPSLNWSAPNPKLQIEKTPFYVVSKPKPWPRSTQPRRAGVSSFGVGGTNAHAILEDAPPLVASGPSRTKQIITLSAKTRLTLHEYAENLSSYLKKNPDVNIADVASTLQRGRKAFSHRLSLLCDSTQEAVELLDSKRYNVLDDKGVTDPVFMFPGQGSQYAGMGRELYLHEKTFKETIDKCASILLPLLGRDIREVLFAPDQELESANLLLQETSITQPCLFSIEYALAQLWIYWGVRPSAMIGHSLGEYVAACISGVFSLEAALHLVANRSRLMQEMESGCMMAVSMPAELIRQDIDQFNLEVEVAAENGPELSVVSGFKIGIDQYQSLLQAREGVSCQILKTSHAFHSAMMEPMLRPFQQLMANVSLNTPVIPFISNLTGDWITPEDAVSAKYWCDHLRQSVRFKQGIQALTHDIKNPLFIEVGPGKTLGQFVKLNQAEALSATQMVFSLPHAHEKKSSVDFLLNSLANICLKIQTIDWNAFYADEKRYKVSLPTYPFERTRYWIEPGKPQAVAAPSHGSDRVTRQLSHTKWFYTDSWKTTTILNSIADQKSLYLIFSVANPFSENLRHEFERVGHEIVCIRPAQQFQEINNHTFDVELRNNDELDQIFRKLNVTGSKRVNVVYIAPELKDDLENALDVSLICQALGRLSSVPLSLKIIDYGILDVFGTENFSPLRTCVAGLVASLEYEYPWIQCSLLDIESFSVASSQKASTWLLAEQTKSFAAIRLNKFWELKLDALDVNDVQRESPLENGKTYLVLGGLDGVGQAFAQTLAENVSGHLILSSADSAFAKNAGVESLIATLSKLGSKIYPIYVNPKDPTQLRIALQSAGALTKSVDGVISSYDMSLPQPLGLVQDITSKILTDYLTEQKMYLDELSKFCDTQSLKFCILMSSLSAKIGGLGQATHAMAGNYVNAYVSHKNLENKTIWTVMNWDRWEESHDSVGKTAGFSLTEGMIAFNKALELLPLASITIATNNPVSRKDHSLRDGQIEAEAEPGENFYERPELDTVFTLASSATEIKLAKLWQDCLKISQIGMQDNFFELGGHSLLAAQLIRLIKQDFDVTIDLGLFFSASTIAELAIVIDQRIQTSQSDSLTDQLALIENMTEEEVEALLAHDEAAADLLKRLSE